MKKLVAILLTMNMLLTLMACGTEGAEPAERSFQDSSGLLQSVSENNAGLNEEPGEEPGEKPIEEPSEKPNAEPDEEPIEEPTEAIGGPESAPVAGGETENAGPSDDSTLWNPYVAQRQVILDSGCICGVAFLGYVDPALSDADYDRDYYETYFRENKLTDNYDFLAEMPDENFVSTPGGQELYLVVPLDENSLVSVSYMTHNDELDDVEFEDVLYYSEIGAPILLRCNGSIWGWDCNLTVVAPVENVINWMPQVTEQGELYGEAYDGKRVYDLTPYELIGPKPAD